MEKFYGPAVAKADCTGSSVGEIGRPGERESRKAHEICCLVAVRHDPDLRFVSYCFRCFIDIGKDHPHAMLRELRKAKNSSCQTGDFPFVIQVAEGKADAAARIPVIELLGEEYPPPPLFQQVLENQVFYLLFRVHSTNKNNINLLVIQHQSK